MTTAPQSRIDALPYGQRRILELREGLADEQPRTVREIAARFHAAEGEIRRLEREARAAVGYHCGA